MGVVYRGVDPVIGRDVAIKTLRAEDLGESTEQGTMKERLLREAKSAGILSHPSIVTIYQAGQDENCVYIAMEFIDGLNLAEIFARGKLTHEATLALLRQAAEALDYAHSKGVIHRDIKPANMMIQADGRLKVADFGIAKQSSASLTKTGATVGSPAYMSPEHVRGMPVDGRADQYSLGVMAFEMLTGRRPHDAEALTSLVFKVVFEEPDYTPLADIPAVEPVQPVFERVFSKAKEGRFPSCYAFWEALSMALTGQAIGSGTTSLPTQSKTLIGGGADPSPSGGASGQSQNPQIITTPMPNSAVATAIAQAGSATAAPPSSQAAVGAPAQGGKKNTGLIAALGVIALAGAGWGAWSMLKPGADAGATSTQTKGPAVPRAQRTLPTPMTPIEATYTEAARRRGIEGTVRVRFDISETGNAENFQVEKSLDPDLDRQATEALRRTKFEPATENGTPVRTNVATDIEFKLVDAPTHSPQKKN